MLLSRFLVSVLIITVQCYIISICVSAIKLYPFVFEVLESNGKIEIYNGILKKFLIHKVCFFPSLEGIQYFNATISRNIPVLIFTSLVDILNDYDEHINKFENLLRLPFFALLAFLVLKGDASVYVWVYVFILSGLATLKHVYYCCRVQTEPQESFAGVVEYLHMTLWKVFYPVLQVCEFQTIAHEIITVYDNPQYTHWPSPMPNKYNFSIQLNFWMRIYLGANFFAFIYTYVKKWVRVNELLYTPSSNSCEVWKKVLIN